MAKTTISSLPAQRQVHCERLEQIRSALGGIAATCAALSSDEAWHAQSDITGVFIALSDHLHRLHDEMTETLPLLDREGVA